MSNVTEMTANELSKSSSSFSKEIPRGPTCTSAACLLLFSCSIVYDSFATPWAVARQTSLPMGFPRQEYWSGLPFPSLGDLPEAGIESASPTLAGGFFTAELPRSPCSLLGGCKFFHFFCPWLVSGMPDGFPDLLSQDCNYQSLITLFSGNCVKHVL